MSPKPTISTRPQSSPTCSSWIRWRSSPTKPPQRTQTTMTLHSKTCSIKHIQRKPITLYEKTNLSVCRRRQCPIEQGYPLEIDRGDPVCTEIQKHRLGLCSIIKEEILAQRQARISQHEFQAARAKEDQQLLQGQLLQQNLELREAHERSLTEMEELRKFQSSTFDTNARRKLVEDQNTILELSGRISRSRSIHPQRRRMRDKHKFKIRDASLDRQQKVLSSSVEETLQRIMEQTNLDCKFRIFTLTKSPHINVCLLEDKVQDRGMYLFTIPYGSYAMDQISGDGWFSGWLKNFVVCTRYFNAEFWSTWCEGRFITEQNHP